MAIFGKSVAFTYKIKHAFTTWSSPLVGIYPKHMKTRVYVESMYANYS